MAAAQKSLESRPSRHFGVSSRARRCSWVGVDPSRRSNRRASGPDGILAFRDRRDTSGVPQSNPGSPVGGEAVSAVYINKIGTAVPPYDVHQRFVSHAASRLASDGERRMFRRLGEKSQIEHRYSFLCPRYEGGALDQNDFYQVGRFPDTGVRMRFFEEHAIELAAAALDAAGFSEVKDEITHLIVVSCTGFHAPGLDMEIISRFRLRPGIERVLIGFMGCYAALNALTLARHIVRSEPKAKVAVVNVELCTLHLQD